MALSRSKFWSLHEETDKVPHGPVTSSCLAGVQVDCLAYQAPVACVPSSMYCWNTMIKFMTNLLAPIIAGTPIIASVPCSTFFLGYCISLLLVYLAPHFVDVYSIQFAASVSASICFWSTVSSRCCWSVVHCVVAVPCFRGLLVYLAPICCWCTMF
jgi:hypothetical protein